MKGKPKISKRLFKKNYQRNSGMSKGFFREYGFVAIRCDEDCDFEQCKGWIVTCKELINPGGRNLPSMPPYGKLARDAANSYFAIIPAPVEPLVKGNE